LTSTLQVVEAAPFCLKENPLSIATAPSVAGSRYAEHVNPQWVRLLNLLDMNVSYERCTGAELLTGQGRSILDFLSGYCVHNTGHNHPHIIAALQDELDKCGPVMLQSHVPESAGELAGRLVQLAGGSLNKVFFASSGSEGVEAAIKFARAYTKRDRLLAAENAFHGLTCGALSLMMGSTWAEGFGPMLAGTEFVPFNALDHLESKLATRKFAAFILEPIQSEAGIRMPSPDYLVQAQLLCRKYGSLFVLDEVQTGLHRTGPFLAAHRFNVQPDMVILAKALSGGLVPVGAVLMSEAIYDSVYDSLRRALIHTSTFSENALAMRAGLATLDVLENEQLGKRSEAMGSLLRQLLAQSLSRYEMVKDILGAGLLCGIEFQAPQKLTLRMAFESFKRIHPAMFGQMLVMRLFRKYGVLTQVCGNNFMVLKAAPPLIVTEAQIVSFVEAVHKTVEEVHSSTAFWSDALGLVRRTANI
jgi:ornithine--oxo-acid transaminase